MQRPRFLLVCLLALGVLTITAAAEVDFIRGDTNGDGSVDVVDSANLLGYLFAASPAPACLDAGDAQDDGALNIADAIKILNNSCISPAPLAEPSGTPGADPTADGLSCEGQPALDPLLDDGIFVGINDMTIPGGADPDAYTQIWVTTDKPLAAIQFTLRLDGVPEARFYAVSFLDIPYDFAGSCGDGQTFSFVPSLIMANDKFIGPGASIGLLELQVCLPEGTPAGSYPLVVENIRTGLLEDLRVHTPLSEPGVLEVGEAVTIDGCLIPPDPPNPGEAPGNKMRFAVHARSAPDEGSDTFTASLLVSGGYPVSSFDMALDFGETTVELTDVTQKLLVGGAAPTAFTVASDTTISDPSRNTQQNGYVALHVEVDEAAWDTDTTYEVAELTFRVLNPDREFQVALLDYRTVGSDVLYTNEATYTKDGETETKPPKKLEGTKVFLGGGVIPVVPTADDVDVTYRLSDASGQPGDSGVPVDFFMDTNTAMQGFAVSFTFDREKLAIERFDSFVHVFGEPADFESVELYTPEREGAPHGAFMGVVADFLGSVLYYPAPDEVIATAFFTILPEASEGSEIAVTFEDGLIGEPPVDNVVVYGGQSVEPGVLGSDVFVRSFFNGKVKVLGEVSIFLRGDANVNLSVDVADAIFILGNLFKDGPRLPCPDAADVNDDGQVNIADPIAILNTLFSPETQIAAPYPERGSDPTPADSLGPCFY